MRQQYICQYPPVAVSLFIYLLLLSPYGNASYYLLQATIFLGLLELYSSIMNVSVRNPASTPADDDKDWRADMLSVMTNLWAIWHEKSGPPHLLMI